MEHHLNEAILYKTIFNVTNKREIIKIHFNITEYQIRDIILSYQYSTHKTNQLAMKGYRSQLMDIQEPVGNTHVLPTHVRNS